MVATRLDPLDQFSSMDWGQKLDWLKARTEDVVNTALSPAQGMDIGVSNIKAQGPRDASPGGQAQTAYASLADMDRAFNQASRVDTVEREPTMAELAKREAGSREKLVNALHQFMQMPSKERFELVYLLSTDYQTTWMAGRKRVSVE